MKKLKGGVIIIGSLLWDKTKIREEWRNNYLDITKMIEVKIPIRYGRLSSKRSTIFTMVFSSDCGNPKDLGVGKFVPFSENPITFKELNIQCIELIKAEHKKDKLDFTRFNWGWGTAAIMLNPKSLLADYKNSESTKHFIKEWNKKIGAGFKISDYKVGKEEEILNNKAFLNFNWPNSLDEYDFFITTSNKSGLQKYPEPNEIAEKFNENGAEYFYENVSNNITTFQDKQIKKHLKMKKINLTIKRTFLKFLFISLVLSYISVFILLHFGSFFRQGQGFYYMYSNDILPIASKVTYYEYNDNINHEYSTQIKYYFEILFSFDSLLSIILLTIIFLIIFYLIKKVNIRFE
ncbi:MAG: hypothetical protein L3J09_12640 [Flavobacteriaceae bacterium]|nr:hypothetical protein [Flavobacteriaceae bacterium]